MPDRRSALTPDALAMMDAIAKAGSFAAAARELGKVPSALTYAVRQLEDALDVLLFDRKSGQAQLTAAGDELLREGRRLLAEMDAVANRVRRVACGWETQLTVAADGVISRLTMFELCEAFYALRPTEGSDEGPVAAPGGSEAANAPPRGAASASELGGPGTRLRLRTEILAGTWEALLAGEADLAIGVGSAALAPPAGIALEPLGEIDFVFAVAPHHPLASHDGPIPDAAIQRHRAVAVADSARRREPLTYHLLPGQDVFTVASVQAKLEAQVRCLGCGFLAEPVAREHIRAGRLVVKPVQRETPRAQMHYAWRAAAAPDPKKPPQGLALGWWLQQLRSDATRRALLERHSGLPTAVD
jgi:DNA-binding transcriptional LysR family regulator